MIFAIIDAQRAVTHPQAGSTAWVPSDRVLVRVCTSSVRSPGALLNFNGQKNMNKFTIRLLLSPDLAEYDGDSVVESLMVNFQPPFTLCNYPHC